MPFSVLSALPPEQMHSVVEICARELLTSYGVRSLVPFALAHYRVYGDAALAQSFLEPMAEHVHAACEGSISEIFDGDAPHAPRGCFAQAWSAGEVLRAWLHLEQQKRQAVRLILAQRFFVSGVLKVANWPAALYLAEHEYRLSGMSAVSAAYTGASIELVCPVLLAAGALPPVARVQRCAHWLRLRLTAPYLALLLAGLQAKTVFGQSILRAQILLPVSSVAQWPALLNLGCGVLLLVGLATRYVAMVMIIASAAAAMMHSSYFDDVCFAAMLAVLAMFGGGRPSADQLLGTRAN